MELQKAIRLAGVILLLTLIPHLSLIPVLAQTVSSVPASAPIIIDGVETQNEWNNAARIALEHGNIFVKNDDSKLYLFIDVVADNYECYLSPGPSILESMLDNVNLVFDVNLDKLVTPDVDVSYITYNEEIIPLSIAYFTAPGSTSAYSKSNSQVLRAFGSSSNSDQLHQIWEFAINLQEITRQDNQVRMGLRVHSGVPEIDDIKPPNYRNDFSNLIEIALASGAETNGATTSPTRGATEGQNAPTAVGGANQSTSEAIQNLEQARTAVQNDDVQSALMYLERANDSLPGAGDTNDTIPISTVNATNDTTSDPPDDITNPPPPSEAMIPPIPTSEPWWTRPEIFVLITVAIISGVVGPLLVAHYGKRHGSKDETE